MGLAHGNLFAACDSTCYETLFDRGKSFVDDFPFDRTGCLFRKSSGFRTKGKNGRGVLSFFGYSSGKFVFSGNFENETRIFAGNGKFEFGRLA